MVISNPGFEDFQIWFSVSLEESELGDIDSPLDVRELLKVQNLRFNGTSAREKVSSRQNSLLLEIREEHINYALGNKLN